MLHKDRFTARRWEGHRGSPPPGQTRQARAGAGEDGSRPNTRMTPRKHSSSGPLSSPGISSLASSDRGPDGGADVHHAWTVRRILVVSLIAAFFISLPWEFIRLYQQEVAKRATRATHSLPLECRPESMSTWSRIWMWLVYPFSWENPECQRYLEDMLTDPVWEVTPIVVLCSLLSRCVLAPLATICHGLGEGTRLLLHKVPWQWQPFILILVTLVALMSLAMLMGYRIEFPWLLRLVPSRSPRRRPVVVKVRPMRRRSRQMATIDLTRDDDETEESDCLDSSGEVWSSR